MALSVVLLALVGASPASGKMGDLYALRYGAQMNMVVPYHPVRLVPSGPAIRTGHFANAWSISPDRSRLVVAPSVRPTKGLPTGLRFVDLASGRVEGTMTLPGEYRRVTATAWVRGRVLAVVSGSDSTTIYSIDPDKRMKVAQTDVPGTVVLGERAHNRLVLLLATPNMIGPATVAIVDQSPRVRTVELHRISAGMTVTGTRPERRSTVRRPGLALAPSGERAYVLGADEPAATINLKTLAVRYASIRIIAAVKKNGEESVRTGCRAPGRTHRRLRLRLQRNQLDEPPDRRSERLVEPRARTRLELVPCLRRDGIHTRRPRHRTANLEALRHRPRAVPRPPGRKRPRDRPTSLRHLLRNQPEGGGSRTGNRTRHPTDHPRSPAHRVWATHHRPRLNDSLALVPN